MNKFFITLLVCVFAIAANAQTSPATIPATEEFGKVNNQDLELNSCAFEKDANAMVLFEKGDIYFSADLSTITDEIHKRVKIFNTNGTDEANIKLEFYSGGNLEYITGVQAETINLVNGKQEITKLDKKLIFTKIIDKQTSEITFAMPNVKPGSIIEYKYKFNANSFFDMPDLYFQQKIPVRYAEYTTMIPDVFYFRAIPHLEQALIKQTKSSQGRSLMDEGQAYPYTQETETRAMANVHSLPDEPYMSSFHDNVQAVRFQLVSIRPIGGFAKSFSDTWAKVGGRLIDDDDFGGQLKRKLNGEDVIISKAKSLKNDDEKIAYVFGEVKKAMKWNGIDSWKTNDGTYRAWENKSGNSAEVNIILFHLLRQSGVKAYPMVVSTRDHGRVDAFYTSLYQFNRAVVYVPVDSTKMYVLDATGKYNIYSETPDNLLNSSGLYIDKSSNTYDIIFLNRTDPIREIALINGEIKPNGKIDGTAQLNSFSYNRINAIKKYKTDGEQKYIDYLRDGDNNLKISSIKFDNMEIDTLPLIQNIVFNLDLTGSDENYIYFKPNLFLSQQNNPFLNENRYTDIDFGYRNNMTINGIYKEPAGYKIDAIPKNVSMTMPDKSIVFRRIFAEQDGSIVVRYTLDYKKSIYHKENYPDLHDFYKKMTEMMNEQIVFKKS